MKTKPDMRKVGEDIIKMEIKSTDTVKSLERKFYALMRKHKIKWGEKSVNKNANGVVGANYEWTMAAKLFEDQLSRHFEWQRMFNVPKDLMS